MINQPADNETPQAEKKEVLKNDKAQTMFGRAQADAEEVLGGRYKLVNKVSLVGAGPAYPKQPPGSPYSENPIPQYNDPLGYSVEDDK